MFPLSGLLRTQQDVLDQEGSLAFHDCLVKESDMVALEKCVQSSTTPLQKITFARCKFDARDEGLTDSLHKFFEGPAASNIREVVWHTPTLSNERVGCILDGCRDSLEELNFMWSFARAATLNRKLVFERLSRLRTLKLKYGGMQYFAELDSEFAEALPHMTELLELTFSGWTMRDIRLEELVNSLQHMPSMKSLALEGIKELSPASLEVLCELRSDTNSHCRLEKLRLARCSNVKVATEEQISCFLKSVRVHTLDLEFCSLKRSTVRVILQALADPNRICFREFRLADTAFGLQEFNLLLTVLPTIQLKTLRVKQPAMMFEDDHTKRLEDALEFNTCLTSFEFSGRRFTVSDENNSRVERFMKRNKRSQFADRALKELFMSTDTHALLTLVLARLALEEDSATDMLRILTSRISVFTQSNTK